MGPFTDPAHPGKPNLYSTEEHRHLVPATLRRAFPAGTFMAWAYQGLKVTAPAATLAGGSVGAVRLAVAGLTTYSAPLIASRAAEAIAGEVVVIVAIIVPFIAGRASMPT